MTGLYTGKTAFITGGAQGIGLKIAEELAAQGADLALIGLNTTQENTQMAQSLEKKYGVKSVYYDGDVTKSTDMANISQKVAKEFGHIDMLINCAGVFYPTPLTGEEDLSRSAEKFSQMLAVNVCGTWNALAAIVPFMRQQASGKIVNLSSVCAFYSFKGYSAYCASKAAIVGLTRTAALELAPMGIHVNAIAPGRVRTTMHDTLLKDPCKKEVIELIAARTPSRKAFSEPKDIAAITLFLLSPAADALHGTTITADEGISLGE